jgi:replicative DNA helicase
VSIAHLGLADEPGDGGYLPDRTPPHDVMAEQSALGGMMLSAAAVDDVLELVQGRDFYLPKHEVVFDAIAAQRGRGEPTDVVTVTDALQKAGLISRAGGAEYLHTMTGLVPTAANAGHYASIVAEKAILRRLVEAGTRVVQMGFASEGDPAALLDLAIAEVTAAAGARRAPVRMMSQTIIDTFGRLGEEVEQVPSPWRSLNTYLGGFRPGKMYVIGARPGVGKTAIALQIAMELAHKGTVAFCSLEMGEEEINLRAMSQGAGVPLRALLGFRPLTREEDQRIAMWRATAPLSIAVDDRANVTVTDVRAFARSVAQADPKRPLAGVVVDYLQLMSDPRDISRQEKVSEMSRQLKILSRTLEVPVIALSQLNRGPEARADKKPALSDLRESGSIEQDADVVILLHRDMEAKDDASDVMLMFIGKNRQGPTGLARARWQGEYVRALDFGARPENGQVMLPDGDDR